MQSFAFTSDLKSRIETRGAVDFDQRPSGISPRRLPDWTRIQLPQPLDVMARMPSGVRLRLKTSSRTLSLDFLATNMVTPPNPRRPVTFSLECADELQKATSTAGNHILLNPADPTDFKLVRGEPDQIHFELPEGETACELWLPHNAFIELRTLHIDDGATLTLPETDTRPKWIHYGSSISHCMEAEQPGLIWPAVAARRSGLNLQNLGFGGQCHLDQFVARTIRDADADIISVKTGINIINMDSMRERVFVPLLHGFLDTIREGKPDTPVLLISPIFCPSAEDQPGPTIPDRKGRFITFERDRRLSLGSLTLRRVRELISELVDQRRQAGDTNLHYLNGLTLFSEADAQDLPDDLHPNPAGYIRMGDRCAPHLQTLLTR